LGGCVGWGGGGVGGFVYSTFEVTRNVRTEQANCKVNNVTHK
jgi:hypothetical protein